MSRRRSVAACVAVVAMLSACDGDGAGSPSPSTSDDVAESSIVADPDMTPENSEPTSDGLEGTSEAADEPMTSPVTTTPVTAAPPTGDDGRGPVPGGAGAEALGPLGSTALELESDQGTVQIGEADVPDLAAQFPIPEGLDVQLASETATDAGFSGVTTGTVLENADFYRSALPAAGFEVLSERRPTGDDDPDPPVILFTFESDRLTGDIAIAEAPGGAGSSIIVTIAER